MFWLCWICDSSCSSALLRSELVYLTGFRDSGGVKHFTPQLLINTVNVGMFSLKIQTLSHFHVSCPGISDAPQLEVAPQNHIQSISVFTVIKEERLCLIFGNIWFQFFLLLFCFLYEISTISKMAEVHQKCFTATIKCK